MATTIITKYGSGAPTTSDVVRGELAVDTENGRLYTLNSSNAVVEIGVNTASNLDVTGTVTVDGARLLVQRLNDDSSVTFANNASGTPTSDTWAAGLNYSNSNAFTIAYSSSGIPSLESDKFVITTAGNVGINTASPQQLLHINGGAADTAFQITNSASGSTATDGFSITVENPTPDVVLRNRESSNMRFFTANTEAMRITSSGHLLFSNGDTVIGTNTSDSADTGAIYLCGGGNQTVGRGANIRLHGNEDTPAGDVLIYSGNVAGSDIFLSAYSSTSTIQFATNNTERMRIDSSGNVGIGVIDPDQALEVNGVIKTSLGSGGLSLSGYSAPDLGYFAYNYFNNNGTETVGQSTRSSHRITMGNGATNAITFDYRAPSAAAGTWSERMRIDSNGKIFMTEGVPFSWADSSQNVAAEIYGDSSDNLVFRNTSAKTERMRIDSSGNLLVGQSISTSPGNGNTTTGFSLKADGQFFASSPSGDDHVFNINGTGNIISIRTSGTQVGTISVSGSATAYNTSSDYRLKENVVSMSGATERLKQLKPSRFNFIANPDTTVDGFLAHEVQDIVPEAITGTKDAVDAEGNPEYQGIDQSKLVPLLVATIQELEARIAALEGAN